MGQQSNGRSSRLILALGLIWVLSGCSGSSGSAERFSENMAVSGSVGDGPIVDADITVTDADGTVVASTTSDTTAAYVLDIPDGTPLPLQITASGGTDLVTGRSAEFPLKSVAFSSASNTVNLTPYTTMAVALSSCSGRLTPKALDNAWQTIDATYNLGWRVEQIADPMFDAVTVANLASVLLSSEALGEVMRRTHAALQLTGSELSQADVLEQLACDLADGVFDGSEMSVELSATLAASTLSVQIELLAGELHVDDQPVTSLLDSAARTVLPEFNGSTLDVRPPRNLISQAQRNLSILRGVSSDSVLLELEQALAGADEADVRERVGLVFDPAARESLIALTESVVLADPVRQGEVRERKQRSRTADRPVLSLSATDTRLEVGESARLSWASSDTERCYASNGWSGVMETQGVLITERLEANTVFELTCVGIGGSVSDSVLIQVGPQQNAGSQETIGESGSEAPQEESGSSTGDSPSSEGPGSGAGNNPPAGGEQDAGLVQPALQFAASDLFVDKGDATQLTWSATQADRCVASGGWTGVKNTSGSVSTGDLGESSTFTLSCSGPGGNVMAMIRVDIVDRVSLQWMAPTENVDGSPLNDLNAFRLYYGDSSRDYDQMIEINNPNQTSVDLDLRSGTYYVALTAVDGEGNESGYSNEIVRSVR